ncbi:MAG: septum formation initiator family protein [Ignavibacteria bacterium]|nr:septum formation initiator family protein [Ignavibacteria bacterium]
MASYGYREHTEPHRYIRLLKNKKVAIMLAGMLLAVLLVSFSNKGLLRRIILEKELRDTNEKVVELAADIEELRRQRDLLQNDRATIERVAREAHGMIKPGEVVYRIRPAKGNAAQ